MQQADLTLNSGATEPAPEIQVFTPPPGPARARPPKAADEPPENGLTDVTKQRIRDALEGVAAAPGFKPRRAQRLMIAEVSKTLSGEYDGERVLCVRGRPAPARA